MVKFCYNKWITEEGSSLQLVRKEATIFACILVKATIHILRKLSYRRAIAFVMLKAGNE